MSIERDKLIRQIEEARDEWYRTTYHKPLGEFIADRLIESEKNNKESDKEYGKWIMRDSEYDNYEHHYCSMCNIEAIFEYISEPIYEEDCDGEIHYVADINTGINEHLTDFCPHCGTKMIVD